MKTTGNHEGRGASVIYKVDPHKLSIKICYTEKAIEPIAKSTTNFENFSIEAVKIKLEVPEKIGQLPAFVDGLFYFASEDEARDFIRKQIGM